jgi:hypothetical protein
LHFEIRAAFLVDHQDHGCAVLTARAPRSKIHGVTIRGIVIR